jgi:hypothetical protein
MAARFKVPEDAGDFLPGERAHGASHFTSSRDWARWSSRNIQQRPMRKILEPRPAAPV